MKISKPFWILADRATAGEAQFIAAAIKMKFDAAPVLRPLNEQWTEYEVAFYTPHGVTRKQARNLEKIQLFAEGMVHAMTYARCGRSN